MNDDEVPLTWSERLAWGVSAVILVIALAAALFSP